MIALYELRQLKDGGLTFRKDAEAIVKLIEAEGDYRVDKTIKDFVGMAIVGEALETFVDSEGASVTISICCDNKTHPARIQFLGLEPEVLEQKQKLEGKLNERGYRLK